MPSAGIGARDANGKDGRPPSADARVRRVRGGQSAVPESAARSDDPGTDPAQRRRKIPAPRPTRDRRQSRRSATSPSHASAHSDRDLDEPALLQRPHTCRRARPAARLRGAAGTRHAGPRRSPRTPARPGCGGSSRRQASRREAAASPPSSSACSAATCSGVYGSFITCAPGSPGRSTPRVRFAYRTSKPPDPSPSSRAATLTSTSSPRATGPVRRG